MREDTLTIGKYNIVLPIGMPIAVDTKVRDSYQAFLQESTRDVRRHLTCLTTLLPPEIHHMDSPKVLHAFGGLGASAQVIDQTVKGAHHTFYERDPECVKYLRDKYPAATVHEVADSFPMLVNDDLSGYDVILLDMSVGTIKTLGVKKMWENVGRAVDNNPFAVVWFTDTACHKIHLNHATYAKDFEMDGVDPTAESYLNTYSLWLELRHRLTIKSAMREAGEIYAVVVSRNGVKRFQSIPYV